MKIYSSEELIAAVRRIGSFTEDVEAEGKKDQDLLDVLDAVLLDELIPQVIRLQEEFFVRCHTVACSAAITRYPLPKRAVGNKLRDLFWVSGTEREYLPLIAREDLPFHTEGDVDAQPDGFYVEGDGIVPVPRPSGGSLRMSYYFRPGQLVKADSYRQVASVDSTTSVTLDVAAPAAWTTATVFDAHSKESGAENRFFDFGASVVSGTTLTFTSAIDGSVTDMRALEVGDYITEAGHAAVPALPRDVHSVLAQAAACRLLESDGDSEMLQLARQTLARQLENMLHIMDVRVDGKSQRLTNRRSFLWAQQRRTGWGR